jgi:hypothetical protein
MYDYAGCGSRMKAEDVIANVEKMDVKARGDGERTTKLQGRCRNEPASGEEWARAALVSDSIQSAAVSCIWSWKLEGPADEKLQFMMEVIP